MKVQTLVQLFCVIFATVCVKRIHSIRSYLYLSTNVGGITSDLRRDQLNANEAFIRTYELLEEKVAAENYPIFEFQREFDKLRKESGDYLPLALENLLAKYLNDLRNHYYNEFCRRFDQQQSLPLNRISNPNKLKEKLLKEYQVALLKSIPSEMLSDSFYEDYIKELTLDIDNYIDERSSDEYQSFLEQSEREQNGFHRFFSRIFTKDRIKWILGQLLLLGINVAQNEVRQYLARREVDKALAEIPEFPLL